MVAGEGKGYNGKDDEVGSSSEICNYVLASLLAPFEKYMPVSLSNLSEYAMEKKNS